MMQKSKSSICQRPVWATRLARYAVLAGIGASAVGFVPNGLSRALADSAITTGVVVVEQAATGDGLAASGSVTGVHVKHGAVLQSSNVLISSIAQSGNGSPVWGPALYPTAPDSPYTQNMASVVAHSFLQNAALFRAFNGDVESDLGLPLWVQSELSLNSAQLRFNFPVWMLYGAAVLNRPVRVTHYHQEFTLEDSEEVFYSSAAMMGALLAVLNQPSCPNCLLDGSPPYTQVELDQYRTNPDQMDPARRAELQADLKAISVGFKAGANAKVGASAKGVSADAGVSLDLSYSTNADVAIRHPELMELVVVETAEDSAANAGVAMAEAANQNGFFSNLWDAIEEGADALWDGVVNTVKGGTWLE